VSSLVLIPAVVDAAGDVPVVAAGGIADGPGLAAALVLGAQGARLRTRFLATTEMRVSGAWDQRVTADGALRAVKVQCAERVPPPFTLLQLALPFAPRALRRPLTERLEYDPGAVDPAVAGREILAAVRDGGGEDLLPFAGQSVELIHDVLPAAEVVR